MPLITRAVTNHTHRSCGGFVAGYGNDVSGTYASIGGGTSNIASGPVAAVSGGSGNVASGTGATVSGGSGQTADINFQVVP